MLPPKLAPIPFWIHLVVTNPLEFGCKATMVSDAPSSTTVGELCGPSSRPTVALTRGGELRAEYTDRPVRLCSLTTLGSVAPKLVRQIDRSSASTSPSALASPVVSVGLLPPTPACQRRKSPPSRSRLPSKSPLRVLTSPEMSADSKML